MPDHTHTCIGKHDGGDHFCGECRRWWWQRPKPRKVKPPRKKHG